MGNHRLKTVNLSSKGLTFLTRKLSGQNTGIRHIWTKVRSNMANIDGPELWDTCDRNYVFVLVGTTFSLLLMLFCMLFLSYAFHIVYLWCAICAVDCTALVSYHFKKKSIQQFGGKKTSILFLQFHLPGRDLKTHLLIMVKFPMKYLLV